MQDTLKKYFWMTYFLLVFLGPVPSFAQVKFSAQIILPGTFTVGSLYTEQGQGKLAKIDRKKLGGEWWAICGDGGSFALKKVKVTLKDIPNPHEPLWGDIHLSTRDCKKVTLLVRGLKVLKPGPLKVGKTKTIDEYRAQLIFNGQEMEIKKLPFQQVVQDKGIQLRRGEGFRVELSEGKRNQELFKSPTSDQKQEGRIGWLGDLDRDGKMDFLLFTSRQYSVKQARLFLSSAARGQQIVGEVAMTHWTGI